MVGWHPRQGYRVAYIPGVWLPLQGVATWDETHVVGIPPEAGLQVSPVLYEVAPPSYLGEKANVPLPHPLCWPTWPQTQLAQRAST